MRSTGEIKTYHHFKSDEKFHVNVVNMPDDYLTPNHSHFTTPHRTSFYHIFLFQDCELTHFVDFVPITVNSNTLLFVAPGQVHQFGNKEKYKGLEFIFTDDFFCISEDDRKYLKDCLLFNDFLNEPILKCNELLFQQILDIISRIKKEINNGILMNKHYILKNLTHNLLLCIQREKNKTLSVLTSKESNESIHIVTSFYDLLERDFKMQRSVVKFAEKLYISQQKLALSTKDIIGRYPKEVITERILLEGKRLLMHSSLNIKEIAYELGFDEPTNFVKFFKKHTFQTPSNFREFYLADK